MPEPLPDGALTVRVTAADDPEPARIRRVVFTDEQGIAAELDRDGRDADAVHVLAVRGATPVGTGRLLPAGRGGVLGRMAVLAEARGAGVGAALLRELERVAAGQGLAEITLHAQADAVGFYERAGYGRLGEPFLEAGIEHQSMRKALPLVRDVLDGDAAALTTLIGDCFAEYPGCVLDVDGEEPWLRAPATAYAQVGGRLWVATLDGAVVGCIGLKPGGELKNLYVAAAARRSGLGGRLVGLVEDAAGAAGTPGLWLWTDTRFTDAHRLYQRRGYRRTGRTRELHDRSETVEYEFVRDLPATGPAGRPDTVVPA